MVMFKKSELQILNYLTLVEDGSGFVSEIARNIGISKGEVSKAVKELKQNGLIRAEVYGRNTVCSVDRGSPVSMKWRIAFNLFEIMPRLAGLRKNCDRIVLFGSCAQGTDTAQSDMDFFIITRDKARVNKAVEKIRFPRSAQWVVKTPEEYIVLNSNEPVFAEEIRQGIVLWESDDISRV